MDDRSDAELQPFLDRLTARSVLSLEEQEAVLALPTRRVEVKAHRDVVGLNQKSDFSCYVAAGLVARVGQTIDGTRQITALHIPGDLSDLHSAVRPVGVGGLMAMCDTVILRIPHVAIRRTAARFPAVAEAFWRDCMLDMAVLQEWAVGLGRRAAAPRLAHLLCELAVRYGRLGEPRLAFGLPLTQVQLADAIGLTGVHVNRSLKTLREADLVTVKSGSVTIMDWQQLARFADFDPTYLTADTTPERPRRLLDLA